MSENGMFVAAFEADLNLFAKKLDVAVEVVVQKITLDLFARFTKRTPVDTGRARASWDIKQGEASDFVPPETKGSVRGKGKTKLGKGLAGNALGSGAATGGKSNADALKEVQNIDGRKTVFITSSLDYMQYLEKGSSKQAPSGIVLLSIAEMEIEIESIIDQL